MKIEISSDTAGQITIETLVTLFKAIDREMPEMELEDIIAMSRVAESIIGVLRYMCTDEQLNELLRQY